MPAAEPSPGEAWAYRARQADPLVEVVVMKIGSRRPIRVLVRFVDPSFEGLEDWVPPARLNVLWTDVEAFERPPMARLVRYSQPASYITIAGGSHPQRPTLSRPGSHPFGLTNHEICTLNRPSRSSVTPANIVGHEDLGVSRPALGRNQPARRSELGSITSRTAAIRSWYDPMNALSVRMVAPYESNSTGRRPSGS